FARAMAKQLGVKDAEDAFSVALLQDMAIPLLAKELPREYLRLLSDRADGRRRLSDLEQAQFGWNHAQAAAQMARSSKKPPALSHLLERHARFDRLQAKQSDRSVVAVGLSALLPTATDSRWHECRQFDAVYDRYSSAGSLSAPKMLSRIDHEFTEFAPVLKL